ncbi:hypothetical protein LTR66_002798 [Elasticomyces elasticus]|nr:hypothetical protein LTR66_002798 [Elasticomyces elasticus]
MPDKDAGTPRVFLVRHGETEWSKSGKYTGKTDIPLTQVGEQQVACSARIVFGKGKLIDPAKIAKVWISPLQRAQRTFELLAGEEREELRKQRKVETADELAEWDYGSAQQVTDRIDSLIKRIRALQAPHMKDNVACDVVLVAHGHLLRAFAKRWLGYPMEFSLSMMMEPGGIGILSYQHKDIEEPAVLLGIGFPAEE